MAFKRIILFGSTGTLGSTLRTHLAPHGEILAPSRTEADLATPGSVARYLRTSHYDLLVNAAGWTDVDACETHPERARQINALAVGEMAEGCQKSGARLIHFGSDYIFPGTSSNLLGEQEQVNPLNHYGRSKLEGEQLISRTHDNALTIRLSWLFGSASRGFLPWVLDRASKAAPFSVVADKWSIPTGSLDLARATTSLLLDPTIRGAVHFSNRHVCTWHEWASYAVEMAHELGLLQEKNLPVPASLDKVFAGKAARPVHTPLCTKTFTSWTGIQPRPWQEAVAEHLAELAVGV